MITAHRELTSQEIAPYQNYLLVNWGIDGIMEAFELSEETNINDIESIMNDAYPDLKIDVPMQNNGGSNWCEIKLDGRPPKDIVCWSGSDFYIS